MADANPGPSESSEALARLLNEQGTLAARIEAAFHRTILWRLSTGRRSPDIVSATLLETLSKGEIRAGGWVTPAMLRDRQKEREREAEKRVRPSKRPVSVRRAS